MTAIGQQNDATLLEGSLDPSSRASRTVVAGRAASWLVKTAFGALLLILSVMTIGPRIYPFETFFVRTGSMEPQIPVGAMVLATQAPGSSLGVGDIIVFPRPGSDVMTVHRIVLVYGTGADREFVTKGDANEGADPWRVPATGSGWKYRTSIPGLGFVVGYLHLALSKQGWVGALAIVVAVWALVSIWQRPNPDQAGNR